MSAIASCFEYVHIHQSHENTVFYLLILYSYDSKSDDDYYIDFFFFDVLLTVHLSIILAIDQLNAQILVL